MYRDLLDIMACPNCADDTHLILESGAEHDGDVLEGWLKCPRCTSQWPVVRGIPRFVAEAQNYAGNFAFEWERWGRVQIDRFAGHSLSEQRFLADSRWSPEWMRGKLILDAGCGAGRFADVAARLGARVVAVDLSGAADACRTNNAVHGPRMEVVQASFYALPFRKDVFDGLYCMGVIQHTPDPERTMRVLPAYVKPEGRLVYNFYEVSAYSKAQPIKYALRLVTPHLPNLANHWLSLLLTTMLFPVTWLLSRIPKVRILNVAMPICASHDPALTLRQQFIWTLLDTFDWYSPRYENRQRHHEVANLLRKMGLKEVDSADGLAWAKRGDTPPLTTVTPVTPSAAPRR
ncbi:MAG: methyltransferase domain-containing protein [Alphaproteobacteria bacterium]